MVVIVVEMYVYDETKRLLAEGNAQKAYRSIIQFMMKCQISFEAVLNSTRSP